jgi:glycosyltransferase involved in cell wall biosynthesis
VRILQVITSLRTGGAEKLVVDLTIRLRQKGHHVDVALFDGLETPFKQRLAESGCQIFCLGHSMTSPLCLLPLVRLMGKYDVVHTHNTYPQLYAAVGRLFVNSALVTTEHSTFNRRRGHWLLRMVDKWMYSKYDAVACISDKAREYLTQEIGNHKNMMTVCNGVDVASFFYAKPLNNLNSGLQRFAIVMVARFEPPKDQDTLIRAMALLPPDDYELWLVGDSFRKGELQRLAKELKVDDRTRFLGVRTDVANILHTADVVVMSSRYEGLSLSSIEGMSVGKPFVASDVDGLHEITAGAGVLFKEGDEKELANILLKLKGDQGYYQSVAQACLERARQYDIAKTVEAYDAIYHSIVEK